MSQLLNDVATSSDSVLISRPLLDVATSMFSLLKILCHDFYSVLRPPYLLHCLQFCRDLEVVSRHHVFFFINLWLPDLEFLLRLAHSAFNFPYVATGVLWSRPSCESSLLSRCRDIRSFNPCAPLLLRPPSASCVSPAQPLFAPSTAISSFS